MNPRSKALKVKSEGGTNKINMGYISKKGTKFLSSKEQHDKTKKWPTGGKSTVAWPTTESHKKEHQARFKRAWNE